MSDFKERVMRASEFEPREQGELKLGIITYVQNAQREENARLQPYMELLGEALLTLENIEGILVEAERRSENSEQIGDELSELRLILARADGMLPKGE